MYLHIVSNHCPNIDIDALADIAVFADLRILANMGKVPDLSPLAYGVALHNGSGMSIMGLRLAL